MPRSAKPVPPHPPATVGPFTFSAAMWLYHGKGAWHFVTLPVDVGEEIRARTAMNRRGWGSVRVSATIGGSTWQTSIFPDKKTGSYLLPVKEDIRSAEHLHVGEQVDVSLDVFL